MKPHLQLFDGHPRRQVLVFCGQPRLFGLVRRCFCARRVAASSQFRIARLLKCCLLSSKQQSFEHAKDHAKIDRKIITKAKAVKSTSRFCSSSKPKKDYKFRLLFCGSSFCWMCSPQLPPARTPTQRARHPRKRHYHFRCPFLAACWRALGTVAERSWRSAEPIAPPREGRPKRPPRPQGLFPSETPACRGRRGKEGHAKED